MKAPDQAKTISGNILTPAGWVRGDIEFTATVGTISGTAVAEPNPSDLCIIPGFIDLHVHGGRGVDFMDGGTAAAEIARAHAGFGTTALLATTMTAPQGEIEHALKSARPYINQRPTAGANILGIHLEGPFISAKQLGAQPDCTRPGKLSEIIAYHAIAPLRTVTLAVEEAENIDLIEPLGKQGIRCQIGHSNATYEQVVAALAAGASGFTHLYNAMNTFHHREPGVVGAALAHAEFSEMIPDLVHVDAGAIRVALRAIPYLYCVTDATAACAMPDGEYRLGRQTVRKCANGVRLASGSLAGSCLDMHQALKNLLALGLSLREASLRLSTYPARFIGEKRRGILAPDAHADLLVLRPDLGIEKVFVGGEAAA